MGASACYAGCIIILLYTSNNISAMAKLLGSDTNEKQARVVEVQAVEGKSVTLPCSVTPPNHDKVYMVFWFQDDAGIPLYSFDVRGKPLSQARHWSAPEVFGSRAYFRTVSDPAQLVIDDIRRHDEGVYRCRVDFRNTQTQSFRYNLTVIVPPEQPTVLDRWGRQLNGTTLGPKEEGDDVMLTCRVVGGRPEPTVRWLINGVLVDDQYEHNTGDVIENRLLWPTIGRQDLNAIFTCQAINTVLIEPRESSFVLDIHLRPLTVSILNTVAPLVADRRYEVKCESAGSRPPAIITWYKGKRQLRRTRDESHDNMTVSELSFVPTTEDDGKSITCRAENPNVTGMFLETAWKIDVVYPPMVSLRLGSTLSADDIKEGDDVYFECHVKSNPQWRKLVWMQDGLVLSHNMSARIIRSNQSLVLQKVTRYSAGKYACSAINVEGETISNELDFRVKYAPSCRYDRILVVGASRGENINVVCEVDADPPARTFRWKFNNSGETLDVGTERFLSNGSTSVLKYTPVTDQDYGSLSCWAINEVGQQLQPCVFQVVSAALPSPVKNCSLHNQTQNSVEVACLAGFDGGLPQYFLLELHTSVSRIPRYNRTNMEEPIFYLDNLEPEVTFRIAVFAVNPKGRSPGVILEELLFTDAEKRTASDFNLPISPILGTIIGAALTLIIVALFVVAKVRRARRTDGSRSSREEKLWVPAGVNRNNTKEIRSTEITEDDPDVIPAKYELTGTESLSHTDDSEYPIVSSSSPSTVTAFQAAQRPTHWVKPGPGPEMNNSYSKFQQDSWDSRPKDLLLPKTTHAVEREKPCDLVNSDPDLNAQAIKDRLMANRVPESCV